MLYDNPSIHQSLAQHLELTSLLDTLPDALIFLDRTATIQYANARAATMIGANKDDLPGKVLWQHAPQLVTTAFYQSVNKVIHTHTPLQMEYRSPVTKIWLHVHISPTSEGVALFLNEDIEPTQFQDSLHPNAQEYLDLLESIYEGGTILTPDGLVLEINRYPLRGTHIKREDVIGKPFTDFPSWSANPVAQEHLRSAIECASRGETVRFEARLWPQPERYVDVATVITPHYDSSKHIEYLICASRNITESQHEKEELRALIDAIPHFLWIMSPDGSSEYSSQRWCEYTGLTSEQMRGAGWTQFLHPDERERVLETWQTSVRTGEPYEMEHRIRNGRTGEYRWFLARGMPRRDVQGHILQWVGTCTDIDEQKQAEERIKTSEENLRVLAETMPQLVWTTQPDGRLDYANQRYLEYTHTTFEQLKDYGWQQFIHPEDIEQTQVTRQYTLKTGELFEREHRIRDNQTGEYRWFLTRALPVRDKAGRITKWFGTGTDIDEQKRIEAALRQSQERARALMDSNIIGIFISMDDEIVEANDTFLRMTGYNREDLRQQKLSWIRMTPPEYMARTEQARQELALHQSITPYEKEYVCKDGSHLPVLVGGVALPFNPSHNICFVLDNSARKELEQRKDAFLSMVSHELRTPLTSLKLHTQLLRMKLQKQEPMNADTVLSRMEAQINSVTRLVKELLDVSKIQAGKLEYAQESVDLDELLREIIDVTQQVQTTHTIAVHGTTHTPLIGDRDRLGQVFLNLINNAIKYSPRADRIDINIETSANTVTVSVHDQGIGIPREQREKIFERFYRAVTPQQRGFPGLGMGLYIVAEIVKHHGGTMRVESEVGNGSTFYVTLPLKKLDA